MFKKIRQVERIVFKKLHSKRNIKELKKKSKIFTLNDLIDDIKALGIKQGDVVFVHSSLRSIGYVEGGADTIINAFLEIIGDDGTLIIPTYSNKGTMYNTCIAKNYVFDVKKSKTNLGIIPSTFLKRDGICRSIHPTHSVSAIGKYAKEITNKHQIGKKTYGENSPWGKILEFNGKMLGIGVSLHVNSQYHYLEDIMEEEFPLKTKVDNIYKLKCINQNNQPIEVEVQPLDPEVSKTRIDQEKNSFIRDYFWEIFKKTKVLRIGNIGNARSWWINTNVCYELLKRLAKLGITIYSTKDYLESKQLFPFNLIKEHLNFFN